MKLECQAGCGGEIHTESPDQFYCFWCQKTVCGNCRELLEHENEETHGTWWDDRDECRLVEDHALNLLDPMGLAQWPSFDRVCKLPGGRRALLLRTLEKGMWRPRGAAIVEIDHDCDVNDSGDLVDRSKAVRVEFVRWNRTL